MTRTVKTLDLITNREVINKVNRVSALGLDNGIANKCYNNIINKSSKIIERKIAKENRRRDNRVR